MTYIRDPGPQPNWRRTIYRGSIALSTVVANAPQYFTVGEAVPDFRNKLPAGGSPTGGTDCIELIFDAFLVMTDTVNVETAGFVLAVCGYANTALPAPAAGIGSDNPLWSASSGTNLPAHNPTTYIDNSVAYDPTSLPFGGTNQPIWSRPATDQISSLVQIDRSGPGQLFFYTDVQVNSGQLTSGSVTIFHRCTWAPVDSEHDSFTAKAMK